MAGASAWALPAGAGWPVVSPVARSQAHTPTAAITARLEIDSAFVLLLRSTFGKARSIHPRGCHRHDSRATVLRAKSQLPLGKPCLFRIRQVAEELRRLSRHSAKREAEHPRIPKGLTASYRQIVRIPETCCRHPGVLSLMPRSRRRPRTALLNPAGARSSDSCVTLDTPECTRPSARRRAETGQPPGT